MGMNEEIIENFSSNDNKDLVFSCYVTIRNKRGLHARAAAKFVKTVAQYDAEITVAKDMIDVPGNSIMGLMTLAASIGTEIEIRAIGPEAEDAVKALRQLIHEKFSEET